MKNKKHHFVHPDPEKITPEIKKGKKLTKTNKKMTSSDELISARTDLRQSFIAIFIFAIFLIAIYLIDLRYNLLDFFKNLL